MNVLRTLALAGIATAAIASGAGASIVTAKAQCDIDNPIDGIVTSIAFDCGTETRRLDVDNVNLGAADGHFFSLGLDALGGKFGGGAAFELNPAFTGPAMVVEVTNGRSQHFEAADIFVGNSLAELIHKAIKGLSSGRVTNGRGGQVASVTTVEIDGIYSWIGFRDASRAMYADTRSEDGFDLDSFSVTEAAPVPLPAGGLLLLSGLGGIAAWRKRRAA